jgi:hypothetical protein
MLEAAVSYERWIPEVLEAGRLRSVLGKHAWDDKQQHEHSSSHASHSPLQWQRAYCSGQEQGMLYLNKLRVCSTCEWFLPLYYSVQLGQEPDACKLHAAAEAYCSHYCMQDSNRLWHPPN